MCAGPDVIEVACWAHVRRKFYESRTSAPAPAHAALARIRQRYNIETAADGFSAEDRRALRQRDSVPLGESKNYVQLSSGTLTNQPGEPTAKLEAVLGCPL